MKYSRIMKERIRRSQILFRELGYELFDEEKLDESYSAAFMSTDGFQGMFFIERENRFLEIAYNFTFSYHLKTFVQQKMAEILESCFEFGCYMNSYADENTLSISIFSKVYFSGLSYASLRDTLTDFFQCASAVKELVSLKKQLF